MSDPFQPAKRADTYVEPVAPDLPLLAEPVYPADSPIPHLLTIIEQIVAGFRHMSGVLPTLAPLLRMVAEIEARVAAIRRLSPPPTV